MNSWRVNTRHTIVVDDDDEDDDAIVDEWGDWSDDIFRNKVVYKIY